MVRICVCVGLHFYFYFSDLEGSWIREVCSPCSPCNMLQFVSFFASSIYQEFFRLSAQNFFYVSTHIKASELVKHFKPQTQGYFAAGMLIRNSYPNFQARQIHISRMSCNLGWDLCNLLSASGVAVSSNLLLSPTSSRGSSRERDVKLSHHVYCGHQHLGQCHPSLPVHLT